MEADLYITAIPMDFDNLPNLDDLLNSYMNEDVKLSLTLIDNKTLPYFAKGECKISLGPNDDEITIKVFFCFERIVQILDSFQLEMCKIAYRCDLFIIGKWYSNFDVKKYIPDGKNPSKEFIQKYLYGKGFQHFFEDIELGKIDMCRMAVTKLNSLK